MGVVSPNGIGNEAFCRAILDGTSGVRRVSSFDASDLPVQIAGEVQGFDELAWVDAHERKRPDGTSFELHSPFQFKLAGLANGFYKVKHNGVTGPNMATVYSDRGQGVRAPVSRAPEDFDPGAKYHVAANVPYMRYFLAHVLQFQFHKALCAKAGYTGPLYECSIYGNKDAGAAYMKMLSLGASKPWQDALFELTGTREMDASPILEYFAPLQGWLTEQNKGQTCGW